MNGMLNGVTMLSCPKCHSRNCSALQRGSSAAAGATFPANQTTAMNTITWHCICQACRHEFEISARAVMGEVATIAPIVTPRTDTTYELALGHLDKAEADIRAWLCRPGPDYTSPLLASARASAERAAAVLRWIEHTGQSDYQGVLSREV